jgi:hypothetical protein
MRTEAKYLISSSDFLIKSSRLQKLLSQFESDNKEELKELNNLIIDIDNSLVDYESGKISAYVVAFDMFIRENLIEDKLDEMEYTLELIKASRSRLRGNKIESVCKIEILLNKIIFCLKLDTNSDKYVMNFPRDNFEVIFEGEKIEASVQKKFNYKIHSSVITRATSGTLMGEESDSLLCDYSVQSRQLAEINPLEYSYAIFSTSKESQMIVKNQESLNKIFYSLCSSEIDEYQSILLSFTKKSNDKDAIIKMIEKLAKCFEEELWELMDILLDVINSDFVVNNDEEQVYCSFRKSYNNQPRTTMVVEPHSTFDRIYKVFNIVTDLTIGLMTHSFIKSTDFVTYILQSIVENNLDDENDILDYSDEVIRELTEQIYTSLMDSFTESVEQTEKNQILMRLLTTLSECIDCEEAKNNSFIVGTIYTLIASAYNALFDEIRKRISKGEQTIFSNLSYMPEDYQIHIDADKKITDLLETITHLVRIRNQMGKISNSGQNLQQYFKDVEQRYRNKDKQ